MVRRRWRQRAGCPFFDTRSRLISGNKYQKTTPPSNLSFILAVLLVDCSHSHGHSRVFNLWNNLENADRQGALNCAFQAALTHTVKRSLTLVRSPFFAWPRFSEQTASKKFCQ